MNRVSTGGNYSSVLTNIMAAQQGQMDAGDRVATQKNGTNLKDYARNAEILTSMRAVDSRLQGYSDQNARLVDKLTTQDFALNQIASSADSVRQTIADALASGRGDTLMQDLQGFFGNAVEGLNARYGGKYLFAGGQIDTQPVSAQIMADLTNGQPISSFFHNDTYTVDAKVDDSTTVKTGLLADSLGTDLLTQFQTIQAFQQSGSGPFNGILTDAQKTFLEGQLSSWDTLHQNLVNNAARNGMVQTRVDNVQKDLTNRQTSIKGMIGGITDADMTKAASDLQQAQMAVQAAAQVFVTLKDTSLLNFIK
ncbi:flagellin [Phenylobacterium aquaticum]|uniref:flagellin n=1 Tax=Phenylobacterium aquaticum TaxID=1763816 RepID=UPI001F5DD222|nr:flagellin [Phenylobacterium aquaticum]MCI3132356.1 flagellin [Phenylobacterium aquaticum]